MRPAILLASIVATVFLSSCATRPPEANVSDQGTQCDENRMAAVEQAARRQFMDLQWVNCPTVTSRRRD